jgi:hypothetical protein
MGTLFLINMVIKASSLYLIQYCTGLLVEHRGMKVNYTRKINHFSLFIIPTYLDRVFAYQETFGLFILGALVVIISPAIYIGPLRERYSVINTMFRSFDRPEDRPYTLLWLSTQILAYGEKTMKGVKSADLHPERSPSFGITPLLWHQGLAPSKPAPLRTEGAYLPHCP